MIMSVCLCMSCLKHLKGRISSSNATGRSKHFHRSSLDAQVYQRRRSRWHLLGSGSLEEEPEGEPSLVGSRAFGSLRSKQLNQLMSSDDHVWCPCMVSLSVANSAKARACLYRAFQAADLECFDADTILKLLAHCDQWNANMNSSTKSFREFQNVKLNTFHILFIYFSFQICQLCFLDNGDSSDGVWKPGGAHEICEVH